MQLTSLGLYVQAAIEADQCKLNEFAYDFMTQAYTVYEDDIAESREQFDSIRLIIGALQAMKHFDDESYDTLITKTAQHSSRLLKKPDQCIAVAMCSHLFFSSDSEVRRRAWKYFWSGPLTHLVFAESIQRQQARVGVLEEVDESGWQLHGHVRQHSALRRDLERVPLLLWDQPRSRKSPYMTLLGE